MSTPPPPPSKEEDKRSPVRVETVTHPAGRQAAVVLRDQQGNIIYPSYVPPETQPPETQPPETQPPGPAHDTSLPIHPHPHPQQSPHENVAGPSHRQDVAPQDVSDGIALDVDGPRPPQVNRGMSGAAGRWEGTGVDGVAGAEAGVGARAGTGYGERGSESSSSDSSSSESGDDDDDDEGAAGSQRGPKKKQKKAHHKKNDDDDDDDSRFRRFHFSNEHYRTRGKVSKRDGRLAISLTDLSSTGYLAKALGTAARKMAPLAKLTEEAAAAAAAAGKEDKDKHKDKHKHTDEHPAADQPKSPQTTTPTPTPRPPRLNIVIMVVGSRGDAQPFLRLAALLHTQHGHRVRLATHPAFRSFVRDECPGVEFFSVGGDPAELMAFMVKNPGLIPTLETVRAGEVGRRRVAMAGMMRGFWRACVDDFVVEGDGREGRVVGEREPFVADAIIANPPSFAHIHCAEALGIPVHLMFTFPYTPTQAFPHPLASVKRSNVDPGYTNWISYPLVEMMVWQGLGDLVNEFRVHTLGLDPVVCISFLPSSPRCFVGSPKTTSLLPNLPPSTQLTWGLVHAMGAGHGLPAACAVHLPLEPRVGPKAARLGRRGRRGGVCIPRPGIIVRPA